MAIWPVFRMGQYRANDHPYHAPQFNIDRIIWNDYRKSWASRIGNSLELVAGIGFPSDNALVIK